MLSGPFQCCSNRKLIPSKAEAFCFSAAFHLPHSPEVLFLEMRWNESSGSQQSVLNHCTELWSTTCSLRRSTGGEAMLSGLSTGRERSPRGRKGLWGWLVQRERESEREYGMKGLKRQRGEGENQEGLRRSERAFLDGTGHSVMTLISWDRSRSHSLALISVSAFILIAMHMDTQILQTNQKSLPE